MANQNSALLMLYCLQSLTIVDDISLLLPSLIYDPVLNVYPSLVLSTIVPEEHLKSIWSGPVRIRGVWLMLEVLERPGIEYWYVHQNTGM